MKGLFQFLQLIRLVNVLIIGLTMILVQDFLHRHQLGIEWTDIRFILLLCSTSLIAAGGNVINDYFDIKADRVNKPDRLIVGTKIKRRWAMLLHWSMTTFGFIIALYLGWKFHNWLIPFVSFVSCNLLWFYSAIYKRKFMIGNGMIATLIGIIPIYVFFFNIPAIALESSSQLEFFVHAHQYEIGIIFALGFFAFNINLIREIIKDIMDVKGDLLLQSKTLPISLGIRKAKVITLVMFSFLIGATLVAGFSGILLEESLAGKMNVNLQNVLILLGSTIIALILSSYFLVKSNKKSDYIKSSSFLKLAMLFGVCIIYFL